MNKAHVSADDFHLHRNVLFGTVHTEGAFTRNEIQPVTDIQPVIVSMLNNNGINKGLNG